VRSDAAVLAVLDGRGPAYPPGGRRQCWRRWRRPMP